MAGALKHFRQVLSGLDVQPLLRQLDEHPELWSAPGNPSEWTKSKPGSAVYNTANIVLRYNKSLVPGMQDWNREPVKVLTEAMPIVFDVMRAIPGEHLAKIVISRLLPGSRIDWHIDRMPPGVPVYWQRYQIPLHVARGVRFCVEDEELFMEPGTAWWFDNQRSHAVFNDSGEDRISMLADIRPFSLH